MCVQLSRLPSIFLIHFSTRVSLLPSSYPRPLNSFRTACAALATVDILCAKMTKRSVAAKSLTTAVQRFISKDAWSAAVKMYVLMSVLKDARRVVARAAATEINFKCVHDWTTCTSILICRARNSKRSASLHMCTWCTCGERASFIIIKYLSCTY